LSAIETRLSLLGIDGVIDMWIVDVVCNVDNVYNLS